MAMVAQETILFRNTLRYNIIYGLNPPPETELIIDACKKANAWDFICDFPDKLETVLGEKGAKLSGGQKQRISIARAIIRSPNILLLDEATSSLDAKNERIVQNSLDNLITTDYSGVAIVIAHRLTTIRGSDLIIIMKDGIKVEEGNHDELMDKKVV